MILDVPEAPTPLALICFDARIVSLKHLYGLLCFFRGISGFGEPGLVDDAAGPKDNGPHKVMPAG